MKHFVLSLGIGLLAACSSDSQQTEDQLENDINQNADSESSDTATQDQGDSGENASGSEDAEDNSSDSEEAGETEDNTSAETMVPSAEDPMDTPTDTTSPDVGGGDSASIAGGSTTPVAAAGTTTPPPTTMPSGQLWDANRQVRFVKVDETPVYPSTQTGGQAVARLRKGDPVVVLLHGGWAMLSDGAYIEESALSDKALPRTRTENRWIPPSQ